MTTRDCRYASLVMVLAAIDDADIPVMPLCKRGAAFSTVVARKRAGSEDLIRTRTCAVHDAAFRVDPGYRDSVRLPSST